MRDQHRVILEAQLLGLPYAHRIGGRRRLETDAEEDHLLIGMLPRDLHGIQRRIDHTHVAAIGPRAKEVFIRTGHAQHIAEGREDHSGA